VPPELADRLNPGPFMPGPKARPRVAVIANAPAPYRLAQHTRIVRELPEIELITIFKHEFNNSPWKNPLPDVINPVVFGRGEYMTQKNKGANGPKQWGRGGDIIAFLKKHEVDLVIITGYNDLGLLRVIRWCRSAGVPCFMFNDSNKYGDRATGLSRLFKKAYVPFVLKSLTGLMPCGRNGIDYFRPYGFPGRPAFYMPHEPDYDMIAHLPEALVAEKRAEHGLRDDLKYINYCARMVRVKRPDLLVRAFETIADERSDWGVVFVGGGDLLDETKALVPDRLKGRIVFTGFVDGPRNVAALYKCCEIHCLPSTYEPWAAVIPEACAAGLAIVSSHVVGAAAECVQEDVNGYTFRSGDADDLAAKLRKATAPGETDRLKAGSKTVIDDWRTRGDPVDAVRRACEMSGILEPRSGRKPTGDIDRDWRIDAEQRVNAFATRTPLNPFAE
jgi:glycosyltransferase involved in cell wall biosynthesis